MRQTYTCTILTKKKLHLTYTTYSEAHNYTDNNIPEYTYSTYKQQRSVRTRFPWIILWDTGRVVSQNFQSLQISLKLYIARTWNGNRVYISLDLLLFPFSRKKPPLSGHRINDLLQQEIKVGCEFTACLKSYPENLTAKSNGLNNSFLKIF